MVADLRDGDSGWNEFLVRRIFEEEFADKILKMVWSSINWEDRSLWLKDPAGKFFLLKIAILQILQRLIVLMIRNVQIGGGYGT